MNEFNNTANFQYDTCSGSIKIEEKYIVKNGTVTCILTCRKDLAIIKFCQANAFFSEYFASPTFGMRFPKNWYITGKYIGLATCGPDNTFDEGIGKGYAYNRAFIKLMTAVNAAQGNIVQSVLDNLVKCIETTSNRQDKAAGSYVANLIRLNRLAIQNADAKADAKEPTPTSTVAIIKNGITSPNYKRNKDGDGYFKDGMYYKLYNFVNEQYESMNNV